MLSTEKIFDLLPHISDIYEKTDIQNYITGRKTKIKKGEDAELKMMGLGLDLFSYIFKQSPKIKEEVFNIVAIIEDKDIEKVKAQPFTETIKSIKSLFEDADAMDFFKSAM